MTTEAWVYIIYATIMLLTWVGGVVIFAKDILLPQSQAGSIIFICGLLWPLGVIGTIVVIFVIAANEVWERVVMGAAKAIVKWKS